MTVNINIQEAEATFSEILNRVIQGEEVTIIQDGVAIARLVPVNQNFPKRIPGSAKGLITIAPDFDEPLPDDILASFEG
ncbi:MULTISPECIES: type II toxin-antitoxin system Phd/YefM family antitoxin [Calothrix]|uniref:Type II toxin-antitoxin system Phd/YefM family antitoxin n=2 Tax=Calothrix TaxID=1186 RepID=A0ABR8AIV9_9CYAN|nr:MULTISPECIES: type II toxin-antitoxin system Phd/YefM family antitoxin [Calothrix]MBD2199908.1 type II toxin-antitoxin system Phd/YefM family antitoxin [Calothrix parietina FACHB-288]MBD2228745.1 type II toxin-antitoxin system Phd/YefM family antitoxin [Calothrix anomala FACHB-343]